MVVSDLKNSNLREVLKEFKNVSIEYRNLLDSAIPDFTFGTEIEFEKYDYQKLGYFLWNNGYRRWRAIYDHSILDGGEIISDILYNKERDWQELKEICHILKDKGVTIGGKTGGHIHIGAHILEGNIDYWLALLKIWTVFEPILYQFSYGEKGYGRPLMYVEAKPFNKELKNTIEKLGNNRDVSHLIYLLKDFKRSRAINFRNASWNFSQNFDYKNTIEFRLFNGSINENVWQNNINMLLNLFSVIKNNNYDKEWINYHFDKDDITNNLDSAITFANMIYTNGLDKLYFLRQYLQREYLLQEEKKKYLKTI